MLDELLNITSCKPYSSDGGMRIKAISITPWSQPNCSLLLEVWVDNINGVTVDTWEIYCDNVQIEKGLPFSIIPNAELKLLEDHPALWQFKGETFFSIESRPPDIQKLMGELFIAHSKACGNWIDFYKLYASLPATMETLRSNQLAIPTCLQKSCFQVLNNNSVKYRITLTEKKNMAYKLLLFSSQTAWPDDQNFGQPYLIAAKFDAIKILNQKKMI